MLGTASFDVDRYTKTSTGVVESMPPLISPKQAGEILGVHENTIRNWIAAKRLPCTTSLGGHRKLLLSDVVALRDRMLADLGIDVVPAPSRFPEPAVDDSMKPGNDIAPAIRSKLP